MRYKVLILFTFIFCVQIILSQSDSLNSINYSKRKVILIGASTTFAASSLIYLNQQWYSVYNTGKFHFFNDNAEWLQMDKVGHTYTTYQFSRLMMEGFDWAGFTRKQTLYIGGTLGLAYMSAIELMDGYSAGWGFSWGDMLANVAGTSLAITQKAIWNQQRFQLKYSFSQSGLAQYNPTLLGETRYAQWLKDYNAQTYWLSMNPSTFLKTGTKFPKWLNVSLGYSAYGMIGSTYNPTDIKDSDGNTINFERQRRFYLSLDVDLTRIKTKSKFLKSVFSIFNILKIPAPTLEFKNTGMRFYYLYY